jgi:hypothetical protein
MNVDSEELSNFVSSTISSIEQGLKGKDKKYHLNGSIKFEIAVVNVKKGEGGLKLFVVDASGKVSKENVSKITFEISATRGVAVIT